jgi:hypothetical protein
MGSDTKQDTVIDTLNSELVSGSELLSSWMSHLQKTGGIDTLFEFEVWLRGLCAFVDHNHIPLGEADRTSLVTRDFSPELHVFQLGLLECERHAVQLCALGQDEQVESDARVEMQVCQAAGLEMQIGRMVEQTTPMESLAEWLGILSDLKVIVRGLHDTARRDFEIYLGLGRTLQRGVRNCRYIDMLLSQRFRLQYDRMDHPALGAVLRAISEEHLRRNVSLALLYLYRFLRYLKPVSAGLKMDQPLRRFLLIFALLHEQVEVLCDFLKARFLKDRQEQTALRDAVEIMVQSLRMEMQRGFERELVSLARERDASTIYAKVENCHGLLRNCYQNCVITLVHAFDPSVEGNAIFPSMAEGVPQEQMLRLDLWRLRQDLRNEMEASSGPDLTRVLDRVGQFSETSLRYLMYQDWGEFEILSESLITAANERDVRVKLLKFIGYLDKLMQDVSKRSAFKN